MIHLLLIQLLPTGFKTQMPGKLYQLLRDRDTSPTSTCGTLALPSPTKWPSSTPPPTGQRLGGTLLEKLLNGKGEPGSTQIDCGAGHQAKLIEMRSKQVTTVLGRVQIGRAYYYCAQCEDGVVPSHPHPHPRDATSVLTVNVRLAYKGSPMGPVLHILGANAPALPGREERGPRIPSPLGKLRARHCVKLHLMRGAGDEI